MDLVICIRRVSRCMEEKYARRFGGKRYRI